MIISSEWLLNAGSARGGHSANLTFLPCSLELSATTKKKRIMLLKAFLHTLPLATPSGPTSKSRNNALVCKRLRVQSKTLWLPEWYYYNCEETAWLVDKTADPVTFLERLLEDWATGLVLESLKLENRRSKEAHFPNEAWGTKWTFKDHQTPFGCCHSWPLSWLLVWSILSSSCGVFLHSS